MSKKNSENQKDLALRMKELDPSLGHVTPDDNATTPARISSCSSLGWARNDFMSGHAWSRYERKQHIQARSFLTLCRSPVNNSLRESSEPESLYQ